MKQDLIDLVYCWCDINDENFRKKKDLLAEKFSLETDVNHYCRFVDNEELRYSLRSVEMYAPWINKIYIITNEQVPKWLNLNHQKIKIVDHSEIMPEEAMPNFNSHAIEHCIKNIPNLSEKFLYANDDMFFAKSVNPDFFFDKNGSPINRFDTRINKNHLCNLYSVSLHNAGNLIQSKFNVSYNNYPHHCIDAYRKSDINACYNQFKKEIDDTIFSQFRNDKNIARHIYNFYSCAVKGGRFKVIKRVDTDLFWLEKLFLYMTFGCKKDSFSILAYRQNIYKRFKRYNPTLFCLNDCEETTNEQRKRNRLILEKIYPKKSEFEI